MIPIPTHEVNRGATDEWIVWETAIKLAAGAAILLLVYRLQICTVGE
jgi:hypothetical protein